jgi:hypothetical protein
MTNDLLLQTVTLKTDLLSRQRGRASQKQDRNCQIVKNVCS